MRWRFRPARRVVIVMAVWLLLCVGYLGGYFVRTEFSGPSPHMARHFQTDWEATFWRPLLVVEGRLRSGELVASTPTNPQLFLTTVRTEVSLPDPEILSRGGGNGSLNPAGAGWTDEQRQAFIRDNPVIYPELLPDKGMLLLGGSRLVGEDDGENESEQ